MNCMQCTVPDLRIKGCINGGMCFVSYGAGLRQLETSLRMKKAGQAKSTVVNDMLVQVSIDKAANNVISVPKLKTVSNVLVKN